MGLAVDMLLKSLVAKGRIERHVQFSTVRRLRATYTMNWESSPMGVAEGASFAKGLGRIRPTSCPSQSEWFYECCFLLIPCSQIYENQREVLLTRESSVRLGVRIWEIPPQDVMYRNSSSRSDSQEFCSSFFYRIKTVFG